METELNWDRMFLRWTLERVMTGSRFVDFEYLYRLKKGKRKFITCNAGRDEEKASRWDTSAGMSWFMRLSDETKMSLFEYMKERWKEEQRSEDIRSVNKLKKAGVII